MAKTLKITPQNLKSLTFFQRFLLFVIFIPKILHIIKDNPNFEPDRLI